MTSEEPAGVVGFIGMPEAEGAIVTEPVATVEAQDPADIVGPWRRLRPAIQRRPESWQAALANLLLAFSLLALGFLLFVFVLSFLPQARAQTGLERRFRTALHNGRSPVGGTISAGQPVARLDITPIGLHQVVVEGTTADQLRKGPGHLAVSPLPGQPGNAVIAAHRLAWGHPFRSISRLRPGDTVGVLTGQGRATYRVVGKRVTGSRDVAPFQATKDNRLTLVTANDLLASKRLVVTANLLGPPKSAPNATRPVVLPKGNGGLSGQRGVLPLVGWTCLLLLVVAVGTVFTFRRLTVWSSYLIAVPVLLAASWLVWATLSRLLPATL